MQECLTNGGNKLTGNHPTSDTMLHIKVRLPVLLCAVKTVKGDFRFCWAISPNVRQNHKERSVRVAERLALPTSDHGVTGSNPAGGENLPEPKRRFIAQSLSCSPFHRLEMTEILSKGRKTLIHPSITKKIPT